MNGMARRSLSFTARWNLRRAWAAQPMRFKPGNTFLSES